MQKHGQLFAILRKSEIKKLKKEKRKERREKKKRIISINAAWTLVKQGKSGLIIDTCKV